MSSTTPLSPVSEALAGRRVLVTGATSGIGMATAIAAANAGARVALVARSADRVEALADELGGVAAAADVTDRPGLSRAIERAVAEMGGLDAVVNSAGIFMQESPSRGAPEGWQRIFDINVLGVLNVIHYSLPHLLEAEGPSIVNVSSIAAHRVSAAFNGVYSATKSALHALGDALRLELQREGVRVTTISPGSVDTAMFNSWENLRAMAALTLNPAHVGNAIVHVLALPPEVTVLEYALVATTQRDPDPGSLVAFGDD